MNKDTVMKSLSLEPLTVEGGWFYEVYRSAKSIDFDGKKRTLGTSIYYLLDDSSVSDWHKVDNDEIWYYHAGSPAKQLLIYPDGSHEFVIIGSDLEAGHKPQSLIPAGTWQAAVLTDRSTDSWGLFGAAVFPGFEYDDFQAATTEQIIELFQHLESEVISLFKD